MSQELSSVIADIYTPYHQYTGELTTRGNRLADLLNDRTSDSLELRAVRVSQLANRSPNTVEWAQLRLKKNAIVLAIPTGTYEAPGKRLYRYVEKEHFLAHIVLPGFNLTGTLHVPSRANDWVFLCEGGTTPSFIGMTDVTIRSAIQDVEPIQSKVGIFNRQLIESMSIMERPEGSHSIEDLTTELRLLDPAELMKELAEQRAVSKP